MSVRRYQTNPLRILSIESRMVDLHIHRDPNSNIINAFSFLGIDISSLHGAGSIALDSEIILEIRNKSDFQREKLGTFSHPKKVTKKAITLANPQSLTYHIFIKKGFRILATNEHVKPKDGTKDHDRQGLLIVEPSSDLGEVAWRVSPIDGSSEPKLLLNSSKELGFMLKLDRREEPWMSLVFPNAFEQILYVFINNIDDSDNSDETWLTKWANFCDDEKIDFEIDFDDLDKKREWVEGVVKKITDRHQFVSTLIAKNTTNA